jgi:hypothetical protein
MLPFDKPKGVFDPHGLGQADMHFRHLHCACYFMA